MIKYYILGISFFIYSCKERKICLTVNKNDFVMNSHINFTITNNSNKDIIFLTDATAYNYHLKRVKHPNDNSGITIQFFDKNDSIVDLNENNILFDVNPNLEEFINDFFFIINEEKKKYCNKYRELLPIHDSNWIYNYANIKNKSILIGKNNTTKKRIDLIKNNSYESYILLGIYGANLKDNETYYARLIIQIDSSRLKNVLPIEYLDSLRLNNIEVFHGVLKSNKVPIVFEKEKNER